MDRPIRVVHVVRTVDAGGAEQQLLTLTRALDRSIWAPSVICTHYAGTLEAEFAAAGVPLIVVGKHGRYDVSLLPRLARALARQQPDIVHTWLFPGNSWGRAAVLLLPRRPIVIASERSVNVWKSVFHRALDRFLARGTDMIVGNAAQVSDFVVNVEEIPARKVTTIRNGIYLGRAQRCLAWTAEERTAYRRHIGLPTDAFVVGCIARPSWQKRLDLLAQVIRDLAARDVPVCLLHLGRDPSSDEVAHFEKYQRLLDEYGVRDLVVRRGFVRDVSSELAVMDALVQTSDIEGFPNAVTEAQAMEVPVVATAAGGTSDLVIHRETGWLVPPGDVDGIVEGLAWVHRHPEEARAWGRAARLHVEQHFSVDALVRNTTALYARLLRERGIEVPLAPTAEGP